MGVIAGSVDPLLRELGRMIGDRGQSFLVQQTGDGGAYRFDLPVQNVDGETLVVRYRSGMTLVKTLDYILESEQGVLDLIDPVPLNEVLIVSGTHYRYYSSADYIDFLDTSFLQHTVRREDQFGNPLNYNTLPPVERNLVAMRAAIEVWWTLAADASTEIDIFTPEGMHIPRHQRFSQITQIISGLEERYADLSAQLNVGLHRIEVFDQRRVSRLTQRLVPVFRAREIDDRLPAQRVLPPIDQLADVVITFRQEWDATKTYAVNDQVTYEGQRYLCVLAPGDVVPGTSETYWVRSNVTGGRFYG